MTLPPGPGTHTYFGARSSVADTHTFSRNRAGIGKSDRRHNSNVFGSATGSISTLVDVTNARSTWAMSRSRFCRCANNRTFLIPWIQGWLIKMAAIRATRLEAPGGHASRCRFCSVFSLSELQADSPDAPSPARGGGRVGLVSQAGVPCEGRELGLAPAARVRAGNGAGPAEHGDTRWCEESRPCGVAVGSRI